MNIIIERGKVWDFDAAEPYSIFIDGAVAGPKLDPEHHKFSFDHHSHCSRFSTTAACMQAKDAICLGLDSSLYTYYINDVDSDVCASIWCFQNPTRCKEPLAEKLINAIGKGDMFAGAIELNGTKKVVEWICEPQTSSVRNGDYEKLSDNGLKSILESMLHRIDLYVNGEASIEVAKQQSHEDFKVLRQENGWALIESQDPHVLGSVWHSGFERVAIIRPLEDKSTAVTLAKKSDFIDGFPLEKIYTAFNEIEEGWGGSSCIGGAVRNADGSRSHLSIKKIIDIIDSVIAPSERLSKAPKARAKKNGSEKSSS
jgi:hypothetical protein